MRKEKRGLKHWQLGFLVTLTVIAVGLYSLVGLDAQSISTGMSGLEDYPWQIKAQKVAVLYTEVDGVLKRIVHKPQDFVKEGDVLMELDSEMIEMELVKAKAQKDLFNGFEDARIRLAFAQDNFDIVEKMFNKMIGTSPAASPKEYKEARQSLDLAKLGKRKAKLDSILIDTELKRNEMILKKHKIRAPMDAVVVPFTSVVELTGQSIKPVEVGETIRASGQPVIALMKVDRLRVELLTIPVTQLNDVQLGQKAKVFVQGAQTTPIDAQVVYKSPTISATTFSIVVEFDNPLLEGLPDRPGVYRYHFRPGMKARVELLPD